MFIEDSKRKTVSATISENVLEEVDKLINEYKEEGYRVTRSSFIQSALKAYISYIKEKREEREEGGAK